jgi:hypothetical protein
VNLLTDAANCGQCQLSCGGRGCSNGACLPPPDAGVDAGRPPADAATDAQGSSDAAGGPDAAIDAAGSSDGAGVG